MNWVCSNPWTTLFVWGNGDVTHCCYSNRGALGNIYRQSLDSIWQSEKLRDIRNSVREGNYEKAGCEPFCRSYRWQRFFGDHSHRMGIPEGLGRASDEGNLPTLTAPQVIGYAIAWKCNLRCTHCGGSRNSPGLDARGIATITPWIKTAKILRLMNGEFTINSACLNDLEDIAQWKDQPRIFLNTNGQTPIERYLQAISGLHSFHLKFSLEGIADGYERIRVGGKWNSFQENLHDAIDAFRIRQSAGHDWKLFLNFCLMRSNIEALPKVVGFACDRNLPLVVNTIHGMKHIRENLFAYSHLRPSQGIWERVKEECLVEMNQKSYPWRTDVETHLNYVQRCFTEPMLGGPLLRYMSRRSWDPGKRTGTVLYLLYRWKLSKIDCSRYLARKVSGLVRRRLYALFRLNR